jgi:hypothetical protein
VGSATVTEALDRLSPAATTEDAAYLARFREVAELLLNRTTLRIAGHPHRFTELELYFTGHAHGDPFTHGDPMQQQLGRWYFHRSGGRYRGGTYKGLDIAFGSGGAFGGILVRGVERLGGAPALIDGPCMVVDHILALAGSASIEELAGRFDLGIERGEGGDRGSPLYVELDAGPGRGATVYATARIGLTLKKGATPARRGFLARPYRFLSEPARIRKGKPYLAVALYEQGMAPAAIASVTGMRLAVVQGYLEAFEVGRRRRSVAELAGDLSTTELCELLGACAPDPTGAPGGPAAE